MTNSFERKISLVETITRKRGVSIALGAIVSGPGRATT